MKLSVDKTLEVIVAVGAMADDYKAIKNATGWIGKLFAGAAIVPKIATIAMAAPQVKAELGDLDSAEVSQIGAAAYDAVSKWAAVVVA
jgi:hypothetical protein